LVLFLEAAFELKFRFRLSLNDLVTRTEFELGTDTQFDLVPELTRFLNAS
jgi:hypothetical protein